VIIALHEAIKEKFREAGVFSHMTIMFMGFLLTMSVNVPGRAESIDLSRQVKKPVRRAIDARQNTQKAEEKWRDEKRKLAAAYDSLLQEREQLQVRKEQLQQDLIAVRDRIDLKEKQLEDIEQVSARMAPFLQELAGRLRQLVSGGMPFLTAEREQRIARLTVLMEDPEVSVSEKFRKAMEALLVEAEYGNTIEVYQQTIAVDGASCLVNIFRLGRVSLFYLTLDRKRCGFYDVAAGAWRRLPVAFNRSIRTAIEIGAKRRPVELLTLPLGRMAGR
jgi:hypothetical protein